MSKFIGVGEAVPQIVLPDLEGEPVSLSTFLGRKLLVFMWASW